MTTVGEQDYAKRLSRIAEQHEQCRRVAERARKDITAILAALDKEAAEARRVYSTLPPNVREETDPPEYAAPLLNRRADVLICAASIWPEQERGNPSAVALVEEQP